jgi:hypothetical protein
LTFSKKIVVLYSFEFCKNTTSMNKKILVRVIIMAIIFINVKIPKVIGQDFIYTNQQEVIKCKIIGFEGEELIYIESTTDKVSRKELKYVAVLFNQKGHFLFPDELNTQPENRVEVITDYFNTPQVSTKYDLLVYRSPIDLIRCNIAYESDEIVNFKTIKKGESRSENKKDLLLIIYKDGKHTFFSNPALMIPELKILKKKIIQKNSEDDFIAPNPNPLPPTPSPIVQGQPKTILNEQEKTEYSKKGRAKLDDFVTFLNVITNKDTDTDTKDKAIEQTVKLFTPGSTIQVSVKMPNGTTKLISRKVEEYLKKLKLSPYSKLDIEWTDVHYVSELKQESDGNYYGIIKGEQRFTGYDKDGEVKYADVTEKNVKVMVKSYNKANNGTDSQQWGVFLGNIGIIETK